MSPNHDTGPAPDPIWLNSAEQRAWLAYIRVHLRLRYEMNRQLQAESGLSLSDYDVLTALSNSPSGSMQITALAAQIGWERSRLSHHLRRMSTRGLVQRSLAPSDRRVIDISLTDDGWKAIVGAAPGHVELVRRLFFDGLPPRLLAPLTAALENVYDNIIENGSLPRPNEDPEVEH
jgi:DNA-binding MarR family transcriptional regulator